MPNPAATCSNHLNGSIANMEMRQAPTRKIRDFLPSYLEPLRFFESGAIVNGLNIAYLSETYASCRDKLVTAALQVRDRRLYTY
jgi:hypothetical protein